MRPLLLAAAIGLISVLQAFADDITDKALRASQDVIGNTVQNFSFEDSGGKPVTLVQFRGRPLLVTLIYTSCADVCPTIIESLGPAVEAAQAMLGNNSFSIVIIGFDTRRDTPERMANFARAHHVGGIGWYFLSGDAATIEGLSTAVGFSYFSTAGGFDHMAQVTIIDKSGSIYQQVYGSTFEPPAIVEPLKTLIFGGERSILSLQGLGDRIKLFCTVYDPRTGRYRFNYSIFATIAVGTFCLLAVLYFLVSELRKSLRAGGR